MNKLSTIVIMLSLLLMGTVSAMTYCDSACVSKYTNWTTFGTMTAPITVNESYIFNPIISKIPELYNTGIDNQLIKLTLQYDYTQNDRYGLTQPANEKFWIDSLNDGLPNFPFNTTNTSVCPQWMTDGTCTFYFELNKTYADSSVRSEQLIFMGNFMNFYYDVSLNLYTPPKVISYIQVIGANDTVSVGDEAEKMSDYIGNFFAMAFELLGAGFWVVMIAIFIGTILLIAGSIMFIYNYVKRHLL